MRFTVGQLRRIIKEEVSRLMENSESPGAPEMPGTKEGQKMYGTDRQVYEWKRGQWVLVPNDPYYDGRYSSHGGDAHFDRINRRDDGRFDPRYTGY